MGTHSNSLANSLARAAGDDVAVAFEKARQSLTSRVSASEFQAYIAPLEALGEHDGRVVIVADNAVARDWVRRRVQDALDHAMSSYGAPFPTFICVREEAPQAMRGPESSSPRSALARTPANDGDRQVHAFQRPKEGMTFADFCVGESNFRAHTLAQMVAAGQAMGMPIVLFHSQPGLGKTHLLHAIAHEIVASRSHRVVRFMMAQEFIEEFQAALHKKRDPAAFKAAVRMPDILLIDDVQRIAGKRATEEEFFDTLAFIRQKAAGQVVLTADHGADGLAGFDRRLREQLKAAISCEITAPDRALRRQILDARLRHYQRYAPSFAIAPDALDMIADGITESGRMLDGAIAQLLVESSISGAEVTIEVAQQALQTKLIQADAKPKVFVNDIQRVVAEFYQMTVEQLRQKTRVLSIARPRQIAMHLACELTRMSLPEIGRRFANPGDKPFDHTTVMHARDKIQELVASCAKTRQDVDTLRRLVLAST